MDLEDGYMENHLLTYALFYACSECSKYCDYFTADRGTPQNFRSPMSNPDSLAYHKCTVHNLIHNQHQLSSQNS